MTGGALYDRRYTLMLGTLTQPSLAVYGTTPGVGTHRPTALRIEFDIEKDILPSSNKGGIRITNMNDGNRAALRPGILATLEVGYAGLMQTLFIGGALKVKTQRQGPDIVTEMECGDGEATIQNTVLDKSYSAGTTLSQVLTDIAAAMQVPSAAAPDGSRFGLAVGVPSYVFKRGFTIHGPIRATMDKLCKTFGLDWSLQNNALQIVPKKHHTGETAELLSPRTGLLGVPSFDGRTCTFGSLLNPRLTPGRLVLLQSKAVSGLFKIRKGKWSGDTHGPHWLCEIEAIAMPAAQALIQSTQLPIAPTPGT
ncbi:MAG: hypothetical protein EOP64_00305 [Sphingomonas sp.]|nr:MAG: hypothetical protein EOP64_00305 [Sphingomonas sp.]